MILNKLHASKIPLFRGKKTSLFYACVCISLFSFGQNDSSRIAVAERSFKHEWIGKEFPGYQFESVEGRKFNVKGYQECVLVFNFWFTGCKPCIQEMPLLNSVRISFQDVSDVVFIAPSLDTKDRLETFLKATNFKYEVTVNDGVLMNRIFSNSFYMPMHMIVDKKGIIREILFTEKENLKQWLIEKINHYRKE